jgi:hypothetical protein
MFQEHALALDPETLFEQNPDVIAVRARTVALRLAWCKMQIPAGG